METVRIGLIWPDSSHGDRFPELCNLPAEKFPGLHVDGARVVAVWGKDAGRNLTLAATYGIDLIAAKPEDMLGKIDLAIVMSRNGALHLELARPFLQAGVPTFVDKPLANSLADCRAISNLARKHATPMTSFSTLRIARATQTMKAQQLNALERFTFGQFTGPGQLENEYGGLIFYGVHAAELALEFMGPGAEEVICAAHGGNVAALVHWGDERSATVNVLGNAKYVFHVSLFGPGGNFAAVPDSTNLYHDGLEMVVEMARTRKEPLPHEVFMESTALVEAMNASLKSGRPAKVERI